MRIQVGEVSCQKANFKKKDHFALKRPTNYLIDSSNCGCYSGDGHLIAQGGITIKATARLFLISGIDFSKKLYFDIDELKLAKRGDLAECS